MPNVFVIIPAAGSSTRFGGPQSKIFAKLGREPMFLRTVQAFTGRKDICGIVLVVSGDAIDEVKQRYGGNLNFLGVQLVEGGATRSESVRNGLALCPAEADLVAVHDAARPCIAASWLDAVFNKAAQTGAAMLAMPVPGTVKRVDAEGKITDTLDREVYCDLWEAQTPQVFAADLLKQAYAAGADATDDAALVEAVGHAVHVVRGDPRNIKVTTPEDLKFAQAVINHLPKPDGLNALHPFRDL